MGGLGGGGPWAPAPCGCRRWGGGLIQRPPCLLVVVFENLQRTQPDPSIPKSRIWLTSIRSRQNEGCGPLDLWFLGDPFPKFQSERRANKKIAFKPPPTPPPPAWRKKIVVSTEAFHATFLCFVLRCSTIPETSLNREKIKKKYRKKIYLKNHSFEHAKLSFRVGSRLSGKLTNGLLCTRPLLTRAPRGREGRAGAGVVELQPRRSPVRRRAVRHWDGRPAAGKGGGMCRGKRGYKKVKNIHAIVCAIEIR